MRILPRLTSCSGFSVPELATAVTAISILSAAAVPAMHNYVIQTRAVAAVHDARTYASAMVALSDDVAAEGARPGGWRTVDLLVGDGDVPQLAPGGDARWIAPAGDRVGLLRDQLILKPAMYSLPSRQVLSKGWRGPYIENAIGADPWGHRYAINVRFLREGDGRDTVVLSAGPNGVIETPFEEQALLPGGDDIVALVSSR